ncbi:MAG: YciI family protein [Solirubrobacterales bacterium]
MRYMVSLIADESVIADVTPEQMEEIVAEMDEYNEQLEKAGVMVQGDGLGPSTNARTLRYGEDGKAVVTDGPFAESKEQIAGFWIFECKDLDEAVEWARKAPIRDGVTEVRAIVDTAEENFEAYKEAAAKS